ncbi:PhzA/PhzB family protein [Actinomadura montaniterrae]|uniref:Phenazine biosynthesis protein n=1 Tax=Actinomadura montaniterrae TaxID=1803903 RepID=A0A6L3W537_9ACTN|nr:PhzA/PhzB family protein [Actinomadura montaniterrae]KAB2388754.1 phenazine biosynthesis protein [Actinomadura montaniterrae]
MSTDDVALRDRNRATVERFFKCHGLERASLFAEDGYKVLPWTGMGHPIDMRGQYELKYNFLRNIELFTGWSWSDVTVYDTQYPDRFWVECDGGGVIRVDGYEPVTYGNHYLMSFRLEDGEIKEFREFANPLSKPTDQAGAPTEMPPLGDWKPPADWKEPPDWTPPAGS